MGHAVVHESHYGDSHSSLVGQFVVREAHSVVNHSQFARHLEGVHHHETLTGQAADLARGHHLAQQ